MDSSLKNALAVLGGTIIGIFIIRGIMSFHGIVFPLPDGVHASNPKSISDNIHLFEAKNFIVPFLAHAIGTLCGAYFTAKFAVKYKFNFALGIGAIFLTNALMTAYLVENTSMTFNIIDFVLAYFPMAFIGGKLAIK